MPACTRVRAAAFLCSTNPDSRCTVVNWQPCPQAAISIPKCPGTGSASCLRSARPVQHVGDSQSTQDQHYHLFEMASDGSGLRQVTEGPYDDFSPRYLPDGKILFLSTRRGGFHRCGRGPCPVHTLALAEADGSNPRVISFHETHEWDPAVLNDGRVIYTRWDYVDRNAVYYQQLWSVRPDGSDVRAFYGNNTFNPVGIWEARPVPGSHRVMATAGCPPRHDGRLDHPGRCDSGSRWSRADHAADSRMHSFRRANFLFSAGMLRRCAFDAPTIPPEEQRWPGHCYRTPYPLSERLLPGRVQL